MKQLVCEMCSSNDIVKQDGEYVCRYCGTRYTVEEARKMMVEGTVKIDESDAVQRSLQNANRALEKEDWEEVEKYYNLVERNDPDNMEAVFFSAYGRAMLSLSDSDYFKREQKFNVLKKSMSVLSDYFETTNEDKEAVLNKIGKYVRKMRNAGFVHNGKTMDTGSTFWCRNLLSAISAAYIKELTEIKQKHPEAAYVQALINEHMSEHNQYNKKASNGLCGVIAFGTIIFIATMLWIFSDFIF